MPKDLKGRDLPKGIYQRKDGRYDARALINGIKIQLYNNNLKELIPEFEEAKQKARESQQPLKDIYNKATFEEWFNTWFEKYKKPALKPSSVQTTLTRFKTTFNYYIGDIPIAKISNLDIQNAINKELARKKSPATVRSALSTLRECFESAKNNNIISINPCFDITVPWSTTKQREIVFLTDEEQLAFIGATQNTWYEEMFYIMFNTGMRIGEVGGLLWEDVDFENKCIHIRRSLSYDYKDGVKTLFLTTPKTLNSYRKIPFLPGVETAFRSQQKKQKILKRQLRGRYRATGEFANAVFVTTMGSVIGRYIAERECRNIVKILDYEEALIAKQENREPVYFKKVFPHAIRHTFCSKCFRNGVDPKIVQAIMGHQHYSTTIDIYTHVIDTDLSTELLAKFNGEVKKDICIEDILPKQESNVPKPNLAIAEVV